MLFCSFCTAAIAAIAVTSPLAAAAQQSSSSVRGAAPEDAAAVSANKQHRVLAGTTGRYLTQRIEYSEDAFQLGDTEPAGVGFVSFRATAATEVLQVKLAPRRNMLSNCPMVKSLKLKD